MEAVRGVEAASADNDTGCVVPFSCVVILQSYNYNIITQVQISERRLVFLNRKHLKVGFFLKRISTSSCPLEE